MIEKFFEAANRYNATDIHLSVGLPPVIRVGGRLRTVQMEPLQAEQTEEMMRFITPPRCQVELGKEGSTDFAVSHGEKRYRVAIFRQCGVIGLVLRPLREMQFNVDDLHLPEEVRQIALKGRGLFLVAGPTGSGKTTTLASLVDLINSTTSQHIITIEDPVEIQHVHKKSIITQREIGSDVSSFAEGIRRALRQDPDVILVGEVRDPETTRIALSAAETGHLVMGTIHARTVASTITRIISGFPYEEQAFVRLQLVNVLLGIINQIMVPTMGEKNVTPVMEIMIVTEAIRSLIRQKKESSITEEIRKGRVAGMLSFEEYLEHLCTEKSITFQDALYYARDKESFKARMEKI